MKSLHLEAVLQRHGFSLDVGLSMIGSGTLVILGPSGCGKTTLLRIIAGLDRPDSGFIATDRRALFNSAQNFQLPARRRNIGYLFQDYALFEHMSVRANIAYGLRDKKHLSRIDHWLQRLELTALADQYPARLSGGQRQRVALARVLVTEPDLLLLDEPFSAIDQSLREKIREDINELLRDTGIPAIIVTHDMRDALSMADHIMLMDQGRVLQMGRRDEVLAAPRNETAARLLGWRNFVPLLLMVRHGLLDAAAAGALAGEEDRCAFIRSHHLRFCDNTAASLPVKVLSVADHGATRELRLQVADTDLQLYMEAPWNQPLPLPGEFVRVSALAAHIVVPGESDKTTMPGRHGHIIFTPASPAQSPSEEDHYEYYADYQATGN